MTLVKSVRAQGAAQSLVISLFVEYLQLIGCQNSVIMDRAEVIMDRAAVPPGQPGRNGHAQARREARAQAGSA
jgi:hypothetical protein